MSTADAAARVIERLLSEPALRAQFRRDPAAVCRASGLDELAEELSGQNGKALMTLDIRESRSSLAGVMMAAALEGMGIVAFIEHVQPALERAPDAVRDVLSRVSLPALPSVQGALASSPAPPVADAPPAAASTSLPAVGANGGAAAPPAAAPPPAEPEPVEKAEAPTKDDAPGKPKEPEAAGKEAKEEAPAHEQAEAAGSARAASPIDAGEFGRIGSGGEITPEGKALLDNDKVVLDADGISDVKAGRIDPRVVAVLTKLSEKNTITVSSMSSDHPINTVGGSVSNHTVGRGFDIAAIDGVPVNSSNIEAREIATQLNDFDEQYRPTEIGSPWAMSPAPPYFTDANHADHIHVGFDDEIAPDWKPPAEVAAGGSSGGGGEASAPEEKSAGASDTLSLRRAGGDKAKGATLSALPSARGGEDAPVADRGGEARSARAADLVEGVSADKAAEAGPKAMAAVKEAMKFKGTAYVWGGSTPQTGFDCSGLMQWAYAQQGVTIPRVTYDQVDASGGTSVKRGDLLPGDLVFFGDPGAPHHVGMSLGGDKFLHAPSTGDVVKISSLKEPYFAQGFSSARRFDDAGSGAPREHEVRAARAAHARDADEARRPETAVFQALRKQESTHHRSTVMFMKAIRPEDVARASADADAAGPAGPADYPGNDAPREKVAAWMARKADEAGLPRELPVMAALVESNLTNIQGGDADSMGFYQMRTSIWDQGPYAGYAQKPELQVKWFIDHALAVKNQRLAAGDRGFLKDPGQWGNWIADVERPAEQYRYRYQERLGEARGLLRG